MLKPIEVACLYSFVSWFLRERYDNNSLDSMPDEPKKPNPKYRRTLSKNVILKWYA